MKQYLDVHAGLDVLHHEDLSVDHGGLQGDLHQAIEHVVAQHAATVLAAQGELLGDVFNTGISQTRDLENRETEGTVRRSWSVQDQAVERMKVCTDRSFVLLVHFSPPLQVCDYAVHHTPHHTHAHTHVHCRGLT